MRRLFRRGRQGVFAGKALEASAASMYHVGEVSGHDDWDFGRHEECFCVYFGDIE